MHFPIVPMEQVPAPAVSAQADTDRPVVLVVDDDPVIADTLVEILNKSGYAAIAAYDGAEALETALLVPPHLVIADATLDGMSGIDVAAELKRTFPAVKVVLLGPERVAMGGPPDIRLEELAMATVQKPVRPALLLETVSASLNSGLEEPALLMP